MFISKELNATTTTKTRKALRSILKNKLYALFFFFFFAIFLNYQKVKNKCKTLKTDTFYMCYLYIFSERKKERKSILIYILIYSLSLFRFQRIEYI